jgi:hypothetical protein
MNAERATSNDLTDRSAGNQVRNPEECAQVWFQSSQAEGIGMLIR